MISSRISRSVRSLATVATLLAVCAVALMLVGQRAANAERIVYYDEDDERQLVDNPTNIEISETTVTFLHRGRKVEISRDQMDPRSLYELLAARMDASAAAHYELGLFCQWNERRGVTLTDEARSHFEEAAKLDRAYGPLVAERLSEIREIESWTEFLAARETLIRDEKNARRKLGNIVDDFEGTVGAREAAALIARLDAADAQDAEAGEDQDRSRAKFKAFLQELEAVRDEALGMLALGHRMMSNDDNGRRADLPNGVDRNSPSVWVHGLDLLNGSRGVRVGAQDLVRALGIKSDTPEARDILAFLESVTEAEVLLYRALGHFYLERTNYEVAERYIGTGMALDPFDRELVELQWMLDEYRRIIPQGSLMNQANQSNNQPANKNDANSDN